MPGSRVPGLTAAFVMLVAVGASAQDVEPSGCENRLFVEFRTTDVLDEPTNPIVGAPADGLADVSYERRVGERASVGAELERLWADDGERSRTVVSVYAKEVLSDHAWAGAGAAHLEDDASDTGHYVWIGGAWRWGPNIDCVARAELSNGLSGADGFRVSGRADIAAARGTRLRLGGWFYRDSYGIEAASGRTDVAQHLGGRTALLAGTRYFRSAQEGVGVDESASFTLGLNQGLTARLTMRGSYRWYTDTSAVSGGGPSVGVAFDAPRRSAQLIYRFYETSEGVSAATWWVTSTLQF